MFRISYRFATIESVDSDLEFAFLCVCSRYVTLGESYPIPSKFHSTSRSWTNDAQIFNVKFHPSIPKKYTFPPIIDLDSPSVQREAYKNNNLISRHTIPMSPVPYPTQSNLIQSKSMQPNTKIPSNPIIHPPGIPHLCILFLSNSLNFISTARFGTYSTCSGQQQRQSKFNLIWWNRELVTSRSNSILYSGKIRSTYLSLYLWPIHSSVHIIQHYTA